MPSRGSCILTSIVSSSSSRRCAFCTSSYIQSWCVGEVVNSQQEAGVGEDDHVVVVVMIMKGMLLIRPVASRLLS